MGIFFYPGNLTFLFPRNFMEYICITLTIISLSSILPVIATLQAQKMTGVDIPYSVFS